MEKLGQLLAEDKWDLVVVDTPPSRNALDFLDAPKRLGSFMDSRLWRMLLAPGRGIGRLVTGAVGLAMKALSTVLGSQMLSDAAGFVQSLDATFGGFREKADRTYELLKRRGTQFVVVSAAEPDALREASFFVDRLSNEHMPLAGLILNRTHPTLCELHADKAEEAADELAAEDPDSLTAAVLRIHADRAHTAKREVRLLSRFTGANPHVAIVGCRRCRSTCLISTRYARSPIRSPASGNPSRRTGRARSDRAAVVLALGGEELGPGIDFGMLLEQGTTLTLGHSAPDSELDAIVQRIGAAFEDHRAVPTDHRGFPLGGPGRTARPDRPGGTAPAKPRRSGLHLHLGGPGWRRGGSVHVVCDSSCT